MGNCQIEARPEVSGLQLHQISLTEFNVAQPGRTRQRSGMRNVIGIEINPQKVSLGIICSLEAKVKSLAATQLQQPKGG